MSFNTFIFDMDGIIIDSEPFWRRAQIEALSKCNVSITVDDCIKKTMGRRIDHVAIIWCQLYQLTIDPKLLEKEITTHVINLINEKGESKKGLYELLKFLSKNNFNIALATSSSSQIIKAVFKKLSISEYFQVVCSAYDEEYGKPHPAVYLKAAKKLGVSPANCIVLEDSVTGLIAAKSASMKTLVIPDDTKDPRFTLANNTFSSMLDVIRYLEIDDK